MEVTPEKPVSILYVITKATWGGAQHYVYDLIAEAQKRGMAVQLAYGIPGTLSERVSTLGIPCFQIGRLTRDISVIDEFRVFFSLIRLLRKEKPDVLHLNSSKAGGLGALAGRIAGIKTIVFTAHGWAFTEPRNMFSKILFGILHYFTVDLSHITIANSNATASYTTWWPFAGKKIHTVHLGIEELIFADRNEARAELIAKDPTLAATKDALWIGTIAELHRNKGLDVGVRAWKRAGVRDAQWVVLGGGEEEAHLEAQARATDGVHFLGDTPNASAYLRAFDIFLLPSRTESFGYVLLEAGLAELPVIATKAGGIPEVVGGAGLLVPVNDPGELARALTELAANTDKRELLGNALASRVREKFSLSKMFDETFALYR